MTKGILSSNIPRKKTKKKKEPHPNQRKLDMDIIHADAQYIDGLVDE